MELQRERPLTQFWSAIGGRLEKQTTGWRRLLSLKAPTHNPASSPDLQSAAVAEEPSPAAGVSATDRIHTLTGSETSTDSSCRSSSAISPSVNTVASLISAATDESPSLAANRASQKRSVAVSNSPLQGIFEVERGVFVCGTAKMDTTHLDNWKQIKARLQDTIAKTFKPGTGGLDTSIALQFMMAGPSRILMKPSIILVCCGEPHRKQLKRILKAQKWLAQYPYHALVLVERLQLLSDGLQWDIGQPICVDLEVGSGTLCGAKVQFEVPSTKDIVRCTLGGTLVIDGKMYAVTVAHAFRGREGGEQSSVEEIALPEHEDYGDDDDSTLGDDSPFVVINNSNPATASESMVPLAGSESSSSPALPTIPGDVQRAATVRKIPRQQVVIGALRNVSQKRDLLQDDDTLSPCDHDWALIEINDNHRWKSNLIEIPGQVSPSEIREIAVEIEPQASGVWIKAGFSGVTRGWLADGFAYLRIGRSIFHSRQVMLERPLVLGDSGSWVIRNGQLCGHILAAGNSASWAYMLPIDQIINDIKAALGAEEISLAAPTATRNATGVVLVGQQPPSIWAEVSTIQRPVSASTSVPQRYRTDGFGASPDHQIPGHSKHSSSEASSTSSPQTEYQKPSRLRYSRTTAEASTASNNQALDVRTQTDNTAVGSLCDIETEDDDALPVLAFRLAPTLSSDEDVIMPARLSLRPSFLTDGQLVHHIRSYDFDQDALTILEMLDNRRRELPVNASISRIFGLFNAAHPITTDWDSSYSVVNVDEHGTVELRVLEDDAALWTALKESSFKENSTGRLIILRKPSSLAMTMVHMALSKDAIFDMDELFRHVVTHGYQWESQAYMDRACEPSDVQTRTFSFVFKYYTIIGVNSKTYPWLKWDRRLSNAGHEDHIDITECTTVLALSMKGKGQGAISQKTRDGSYEKGQTHDIFSPWVLLNMSFCSDDIGLAPLTFSTERFSNGAIAFLTCLSSEYGNAARRCSALRQFIRKLVTPPSDFMFDVRLRDALLFEDRNFTYSRRYFWAYNTLGVINENIDCMVSAYRDTFSEQFWAARDSRLWPHPAPSSPEGRRYILELRSVRDELEAAIARLQQILDKNQRIREEIKDLREQLFTGSSVQESYRARQQGVNIKLLSITSMMFLPLSFITSIFGVTDIPISNWGFPLAMVLVAASFIMVILITQTEAGSHIARQTRVSVHSMYEAIWSEQRASVFSAFAKRRPKMIEEAPAEKSAPRQNDLQPEVIVRTWRSVRKHSVDLEEGDGNTGDSSNFPHNTSNTRSEP